MPIEFLVYPARNSVSSTTSTENVVEGQFKAAGLSADTPVRVTYKERSTYVPLTVSIGTGRSRVHSTEFHRAAQSAIRGKEAALRELSKW